MKRNTTILAMVLAMACVAAPGAARGQYLLPNGAMAESFLGAATSDTPDARQYADGTKAIRESRWGDAVKVFDKVAQAKGPHAAGALYWKAYAESKLGNASGVLENCATLRNQYVGSTWIEDCGALEIEVGAKNGQPVKPNQAESDELRLLALAAMMNEDPTRAKAQVEQIVQGDSSERLKESALFILGNEQPDLSNPEIVRISYMEGDVRIARASKNDGDGKNATWETALMNLPLEAGDNLVTGKDGRVEIEFEDDSTMYLAENSALSFEDMRSTDGVPRTELALVNGAVTMHLDSLMAGETFLVHTPTNEVLTRYPQKADMRVSSFLDGVAVTPLTPGKLDISGGVQANVTPDKTFLFEQGQKMTAATAEQTPDYKAFDAWVADRYATRTADTAAVMEEAGLQHPIPGLAQMKGKGTFYDCQPYGKCWEPTPKQSMVSSGGAAPVGGAGDWLGMDEFFPCMPWAMGYDYLAFMTYQPALPMPADFAMYGGLGMMDPFAWTVCHAGYWVPQGNGGYAWVVGHRIHHHPPVRWVRNGRTVAAVPIHPRDVKGQPPVNRDHGFAAQKGKEGLRVTPVKLDGSRPIEVMKEAPREFRHEEEAKLAKASAPHMEAHSLKEMGTARAGVPHPGVPLTFNRQQGFMTTHQVVQGGRTVAVNTPVGRTGPAFGGHGGATTGFGASGGSRGGASSGGGFHGGSSGGGGGAAHAGTPSGGGSSISVSSSSSSASSGGSHK